MVDRNPACLVTTTGDLQQADSVSSAPSLIVAEWSEFFRDYLSAWSKEETSQPSDSIVPSPLMPHLLYEWVRDRAIERWPHREIGTRHLQGKPATPWQSSAPDGTHYVSFATWTCPVNCIEPAVCPHTRSERTWTMPTAMKDYVASERRAGRSLEGPLVFHCTHRAYGVGMIPVASAISADGFVAVEAERGAANFIVATVSHCHGAVNVLSVA